MSRICKITGKRPRVGNNVSKAHNKTKRRQYPNLQNKKVFVPETGKHVRLRISTKAIKTIDKYGPDGISKIIKLISDKAVKLQSGYIFDYAFVMLLGFSLLLTFFVIYK